LVTVVVVVWARVPVVNPVNDCLAVGVAVDIAAVVADGVDVVANDVVANDVVANGVVGGVVDGIDVVIGVDGVAVLSVSVNVASSAGMGVGIDGRKAFDGGGDGGGFISIDREEPISSKYSSLEWDIFLM